MDKLLESRAILNECHKNDLESLSRASPRVAFNPFSRERYSRVRGGKEEGEKKKRVKTTVKYLLLLNGTKKRRLLLVMRYCGGDRKWRDRERIVRSRGVRSTSMDHRERWKERNE